MKPYFLLSQHPILKPLSIQQRLLVFSQAMKRISSMQKIALNLFKLAWLIPPFILLARHESTMHVVSAGGLLIVYPLVLRPFQIWLSESFFDEVIEEVSKDTGSSSV